MNNPAVLLMLLILALVILAGNTLIALAFLRGRRRGPHSPRRGDDQAADELHARVQRLEQRRK
jgi:hypothetical protein